MQFSKAHFASHYRGRAIRKARPRNAPGVAVQSGSESAFCAWGETTATGRGEYICEAACGDDDLAVAGVEARTTRRETRPAPAAERVRLLAHEGEQAQGAPAAHRGRGEALGAACAA
ncbi:hypothetical protein K438DRAFT_1795656 [Mycena galopus ATCC 62051]|nr:hypothetical protein K438DRAFT_1795656 [Mycena galopus ATCC 62051]